MPENLNISLSEIDIHTLIESIETGKIVLPDFQRDFVWPTDQVGKLLESLLNGYYVNTLLALPVAIGERQKPPFPPRRVEGVDAENRLPFQMQMILDGQQRITSLFYAVTAPDIPLANTVYPQVFCLRLSKVLENDLDEDAIIWRRGDWDSTQRLVANDLELQLKEDRIPFTIFKSAQVFTRWRRGMEKIADKNGLVKREDIECFEDRTEVFRNYKMPFIQLAADTPEGKVVRTFERINTQGLELGVFDILTARLWTHEIRLRDLWDGSVERYSIISKYASEIGEERFRELTLKTLALSRGGECKDQALRELDPDGFEDDWERATRLLDRALEKLLSKSQGGFGVTALGVPYTTMLAPLANLLAFAEEAGSYPSGENLERVQKWYWSSVFSKRYSGSSDTRSYQDLNQMRRWMLEDGEVPESVASAPQRIPTEVNLMALTRGGLYRGIMSLLALNNAYDFSTLESVELHKADDHHIFPKSRLAKGVNGRKYEESVERDRILNRTIIEARSNRFKYRDQLPAEYVPKMMEEHPNGEAGVRILLRNHFIDDSAFEAMLQNDYETFCIARKATMQQAIERKVGYGIEWEPREG